MSVGVSSRLDDFFTAIRQALTIFTAPGRLRNRNIAATAVLKCRHKMADGFSERLVATVEHTV